MKLDYHVVNLQAVLRYYAKDLKPVAGRVVTTYETYVDQAKGVVIFRVFTEDAPVKSK